MSIKCKHCKGDLCGSKTCGEAERKNIYKFYADFGRMGELSSVFIATGQPSIHVAFFC